MARNQEKAQSTLYRFREAQAAELGIAPSSARRPRVASRVTNLRECEKWRGEVLREISRKVSKIQDFGLTDYEVRDVNDEINRLLREKSAWEYQIVALGGANYKRGVPKMLDDSGREVPGTRGYKYFGRAKDLPGVKELLNRSVEEEAEMESFRSLKYKRFANQPPAYYGDDDEEDGLVLAAEELAEEQAWKQGCEELTEELGEDAAELGLQAEIPRKKPKSLKQIQEANAAMDVDGGSQEVAQDDGITTQMTAILNVLDEEELKPPAVPDRQQIEAMILQAKKRALRQQCECQCHLDSTTKLTIRLL
jgi:pre-mRNA-splicing factor ISY1